MNGFKGKLILKHNDTPENDYSAINRLKTVNFFHSRLSFKMALSCFTGCYKSQFYALYMYFNSNSNHVNIPLLGIFCIDKGELKPW